MNISNIDYLITKRLIMILLTWIRRRDKIASGSHPEKQRARLLRQVPGLVSRVHKARVPPVSVGPVAADPSDHRHPNNDHRVQERLGVVAAAAADDLSAARRAARLGPGLWRLWGRVWSATKDLRGLARSARSVRARNTHAQVPQTLSAS